MKTVVVLAVLLTATLAHAGPSSTIEPPPGWVEDEASGAEQLAKVRGMAGVVRADLRLWDAPDDTASLLVLEIETKSEAPGAREMIEGMERGAVRSAAATRQLTLTRREEGNAIIVDHVVETPERRLHFHRHYALDAKGAIHNTSVTCGGPIGSELPACTTALASFRWLVTPVPLPKTRSRVEQIAYLVGQGIGYVGIARVLVWLVLRLARKKPAR